MQKASWILLTIVALLIALASAASAYLAYFGPAEQIPVGPTNVAELAAGKADVEQALRGQRGTAAAMGLGFAALMLCLAAGPYRRGRLWAWWTILFSTLVMTCVVALRVVTVGTQLGVSTAVILFGIVAIALLLDFRRLSRPQ